MAYARYGLLIICLAALGGCGKRSAPIPPEGTGAWQSYPAEEN